MKRTRPRSESRCVKCSGWKRASPCERILCDYSSLSAAARGAASCRISSVRKSLRSRDGTHQPDLMSRIASAPKQQARAEPTHLVPRQLQSFRGRVEHHPSSPPNSIHLLPVPKTIINLRIRGISTRRREPQSQTNRSVKHQLRPLGIVHVDALGGVLARDNSSPHVITELANSWKRRISLTAPGDPASGKADAPSFPFVALRPMMKSTLRVDQEELE